MPFTSSLNNYQNYVPRTIFASFVVYKLVKLSEKRDVDSRKENKMWRTEVEGK
jgi:hypothetical protein